MPSQSQHVLLTTMDIALHTTPERQLSLSTDILPPPTLDERSRVLCTHSRLLVSRAQRARETSQQVREKIRHRRMKNST
jgi:hypothetical protein